MIELLGVILAVLGVLGLVGLLTITQGAAIALLIVGVILVVFPTVRGRL